MARTFPERDLTATAALKLRLDEWLRQRLEEAAKRSRRSLNAEIIARLEASLVYRDVVIIPAKPGAKPEPMFDPLSHSGPAIDQETTSLKDQVQRELREILGDVRKLNYPDSDEEIEGFIHSDVFEKYLKRKREEIVRDPEEAHRFRERLVKAKEERDRKAEKKK